jgi:hypothetical protein
MSTKAVFWLRVCGLVLACGSLMACNPAGRAIGRAIFTQVAMSAVDQAARNTVNSATNYSMQCGNCGAMMSWQGRVSPVRCWKCNWMNNIQYQN